MKNENNEFAIIFNLREPEILIPNQIISTDKISSNVSETRIAPICSTAKSVCAYPKEWTEGFGNEYYSHPEIWLSENFYINARGKTFINEQANTTDKSIIKETIDSILSLPKEDSNEQ